MDAMAATGEVDGGAARDRGRRDAGWGAAWDGHGGRGRVGRADGDSREWGNVLDDARIDELGSGICWRGHRPVDVGPDSWADSEQGIWMDGPDALTSRRPHMSISD